MAALSFTIISANKGNTHFPKKQIREIIACVVADNDVIDRSTFICNILWNVLLSDEKKSGLPDLVIQTLEQCENQTVVDEVTMVLRDCGYLNGAAKGLSQREILSVEPYKKSCPQPGSIMGSLYNVW